VHHGREPERNLAGQVAAKFVIDQSGNVSSERQSESARPMRLLGRRRTKRSPTQARKRRGRKEGVCGQQGIAAETPSRAT
jgi:hypothetical protein